jgi:hypothetical protein
MGLPLAQDPPGGVMAVPGTQVVRVYYTVLTRFGRRPVDQDIISGVGANKSLAIKAALPSPRRLRLHTLAGIPWPEEWTERKGDRTC